MKSILITFSLLLSVAQSSFTTAASSDFVSTWRTTGYHESITLPLINGGEYNFYVGWGDGSEGGIITSWNDPHIEHTYSSPGEYTVTIVGQLEGWSFNNGTHGTDDGVYFQGKSVEKIIEISQWGSMALSSEASSPGGYFYGAIHLDITATDAPDLIHTTDMTAAFRSARSLDDSGNLDAWDVSNVTDMRNLFRGARGFDQPLKSWNVSSVTNMHSMFFRSPFNQDISGWNVSNVNVFGAMFYQNNEFNQAIGRWDTSSAIYMDWMFAGTSFDQDISQWNISSVVSMENMINGPGMTTHYDRLLIGWSGQALKQTDISFDCEDCQYTPGGEAEKARSRLITDYGWTIVDNGPIPSWDGGAEDLIISSTANWDNDLELENGSNIRLNIGVDTITWDAPDTLNDIVLDSGFGGTLATLDDTPFTSLGRITVEAGTFATDAVITTMEVDQKADGELKLTLDDVVEYGRINALGDVWLNGTLTVVSDGLTFKEGDSFTLLTWSSLHGTFDTINLPILPDELVWDTGQLYGNGTVSVVLNPPDGDGDGVGDKIDNCRFVANPNQVDNDHDGQGDLCDPDDDNDGQLDIGDIFPLNPNESVDSDGDGVGDNGDHFPNDPLESVDSDGDGVGDNNDAFPLNPAQSVDTDNDRIADPLDNCPTVGNPDQSNNDRDEWGDACDPDDDNDGIWDEDDGIGGIFRRDHDNDGYDDNEDGDDDNDGIEDYVDGINGERRLDHDNDGVDDRSDSDDDNDGIEDLDDGVGGAFRYDYDNDGIDDDLDTDDDNDGIEDEADLMPFDTDNDGLNNAIDRDDDNDGITDSLEGYGILDSDRDGLPDSIDTDSDNDSISDLLEASSPLKDSNGDRHPDHFVDENRDGLHDDISEAFRPRDLDQDGIPDYLDLDSDEDGVEDSAGQGIYLDQAIEAISPSGGGVGLFLLMILSISTIWLRRENIDSGK